MEGRRHRDHLVFGRSRSGEGGIAPTHGGVSSVEWRYCFASQAATYAWVWLTRSGDRV